MAKKKNNSIWMWLIGLPLLVLWKLIMETPKRGRRRRRW